MNETPYAVTDSLLPTLSIVYVLSNPAMPGIVKIGKTTQRDAQTRIDQLYTTGVPVPFHLEFACKVANPDEVEKALHIAFGPSRVNPKREFFQIEPSQAIAILKLLHAEDKTLEVSDQQSSVPAQEIAAGENLRSRRPNLNFLEMGIPIGSVLKFTEDDTTATVISEKRVLYRDQETSLTAATRLALGLSYSVSPGAYWIFDGRLIRDIYNETYQEAV